MPCFYFSYYNSEYSDFDKKDEDSERLAKFVEDVKCFLKRLVKHEKAFIPELYEHVKRAWSKAEERFDKVCKQLRDLSITELSKLDEAGLTGWELVLKLHNIEYWFGELIAGLGNNALQKLFDGINNLLDSICNALGIHNALKEIKDAIRDALA